MESAEGGSRKYGVFNFFFDIRIITMSPISVSNGSDASSSTMLTTICLFSAIRGGHVVTVRGASHNHPANTNRLGMFKSPPPALEFILRFCI